MLIFNKMIIGNKFYDIRRKHRMTREEVAEKADISDRTYADIERGTVNMRIETLLHICEALNTTPNDVLTENDDAPTAKEISDKINNCGSKEREIALKLISVYLDNNN